MDHSPVSRIGVAVALALAPVAAANAQLSEIIVTATKREQSMQEVPVSVAAFDADTLREARILRVEEFGALAANTMITTGNSIGITSVAIRGVSTEAANVGLSTAIPIYVDGVPQGRGQTFNNAMFDLQSVEVLRGPQGTLFGQSSTGGAILFRTRRPDTSAFSGNARVLVGNKDQLALEGFLNAPFLDDRAAFRISASTHEIEGFEYNTTLQRYVNDIDSKAVRAQFLVKPNDDLEIVLRGDYTEDEQAGPTPDFSTSNVLNDQTTDRIVNQNNLDTTDRDTHSIGLEINYDLGWARLTSISAYQAFDYFNFNDVDRLPTNLLNTTTGLSQHQTSSELRLASTDSDSPVTWVGGVFWFTESTRTSFTAQGLASGNVLRPVGDATRETDTWAVFGQADWRFASNWIGTLGLRYTQDDKTATKRQYPPLVAAINVTQTADDGEVSGTAVLQYVFSDSVRAYVSYARGFKASGFNLQPGGETDIGAEPEYVDAWEVGLKSQFADNRLRVNAAIFTYDYTDLQRFRFVQNPTPGGLPILTFGNAGETKASGVELEVVAQPTDAWHLGLTYGYLDAEFENFVTSSGNFTGNVPARSPENSFSAYVQFGATNMSWADFSGRVDYAWRDDWYDTDANTANRKTDALGLLNARLALTSKSGRYTAALWGRNLTDEVSQSSFSVGLGPGIGRLLIPGRTYGVELSAGF